MKRKLIYLFLLLCTVLFQTGCIVIDANAMGGMGKRIEGSGNRITETRDPGQFKAIDFDGAASVSLIKADKENIIIKTDNNLLSYIHTQVVDGKLDIEFKKNLDPSKSIEIVIEYVNIEYIDWDGVGKLVAHDMNEEKLKVDFDGVGGMTLLGQVNYLDVDSSGVGSLKADGLHSRNAKVNSSGVGSVTVYASESVDINASGVGSVKYAGNPPIVKKNASGIGGIHAL